IFTDVPGPLFGDSLLLSGDFHHLFGTFPHSFGTRTLLFGISPPPPLPFSFFNSLEIRIPSVYNLCVLYFYLLLSHLCIIFFALLFFFFFLVFFLSFFFFSLCVICSMYD